MSEYENPLLIREKNPKADWYHFSEQNFRDIMNRMSLIHHESIGHFERQKEKQNNSRIFLSVDNKIKIPSELLEKMDWSISDELFADIFDEELKQIVIGKKLEHGDAVKALDRISELLNDNE